MVVASPAPHHDGSPTYVSDPSPALGDRVELSLRVPGSTSVRAVALRVVVDGEPAWVEATPEVDRDGTTWRASLTASAPELRYRFLLDAGPHRYCWQTARGIVDHDPTDAFDHRLTTHGRAPDWARHGAVYQVFPDRFARSGRDHPRPPWAVPAQWDDPVVGAGADAMVQWFGGDLDGVVDHLDHVAALGASAVWLTPIWPAGSNHRYDATTFDRVDPALGGDAALARLAAAARRRGLRLVGDLTTNHTGVGHDWFRRAQQDRTSTEAAFYTFRDEAPGYRCWLDVPSLPTLDHTAPELAARLTHGPESVVARWLGRHGLDGWRIDVANMTGRAGTVDVNHDVARRVRRTATDARPDALVVAEHSHDASGDLDGAGWHATMNYAGFTNPVWSWLRGPELPVDPRSGRPITFMGRPTTVPRLPGTAVAAAMRDVVAATPWAATAAAWNLLGSHDTARIATVVGDADRHRVAIGLLAAHPGTPVVFAGDEWGLTAPYGELARTPMPWPEVSRPDGWQRLEHTYRDLLQYRAGLPALQDGGLEWLAADDDVIAFRRVGVDESVLVVAMRSGGVALRLHGLAPVGAGPGDRVAGDLVARSGSDGTIVVTGQGPGFGWWALPGMRPAGRSATGRVPWRAP